MTLPVSTPSLSLSSEVSPVFGVSAFLLVCLVAAVFDAAGVKGDLKVDAAFLPFAVESDFAGAVFLTGFADLTVILSFLLSPAPLSPSSSPSSAWSSLSWAATFAVFAFLGVGVALSPPSALRFLL